MQVNDIIHGFQVKHIRSLEELGGDFYEMEHLRTGAQLCWLARPDENKAFSIAFKTLPEDSTGVFHILEHSVLCGSDKYPLKEPFVELLKSSVQTFLNAMTYPDKTVYPVSTRNCPPPPAYCSTRPCACSSPTTATATIPEATPP